MNICMEQNCSREQRANHLCVMHYKRTMRLPRLSRPYVRRMGSAASRVYPRLSETATGCWIWTGSGNGAGYGSFTYKSQKHLVHRWVYEDMIGPIPEGLVIDHLCRNRRCANPYHLDPVTTKQNLARGSRHNSNVLPTVPTRGKRVAA